MSGCSGFVRLICVVLLLIPSAYAQRAPHPNLSRAEVGALVATHEEQVSRYAHLYDEIEADMVTQGVSDWPTCLTEHLVRCGEIATASTAGNRTIADSLKREAVMRGFVYVPHFLKMIDLYEANRATYPTLRDYFPSLVRSLAGAYPVDILPEFWHFATEWMVAGPFRLDWDEQPIVDDPPPGFHREYPPEHGFNPDAQFETVDGMASWKHVPGDTTNPKLDFLRLFKTHENVLTYARTVIVAPRAMETILSIGTNDGAKVWLNGEQVFIYPRDRATWPHQDKIPVSLRAGENVLLFKVFNTGGGWQLYCALSDPRRELTYTPTAQPAGGR